MHLGTAPEHDESPEGTVDLVQPPVQDPDSPSMDVHDVPDEDQSEDVVPEGFKGI